MNRHLLKKKLLKAKLYIQFYSFKQANNFYQKAFDQFYKKNLLNSLVLHLNKCYVSLNIENLLLAYDQCR